LFVVVGFVKLGAEAGLIVLTFVLMGIGAATYIVGGFDCMETIGRQPLEMATMGQENLHGGGGETPAWVNYKEKIKEEVYNGNKEKVVNPDEPSTSSAGGMKDEGPEICGVCLGEFDDGDMIKRLPCNENVCVIKRASNSIEIFPLNSGHSETHE
jgi:hypothetical protein